MLPKPLLFCMVALCCLPGLTIGQTLALPTDIDLKAAYCLRVNKALEKNLY